MFTRLDKEKMNDFFNQIGKDNIESISFVSASAVGRDGSEVISENGSETNLYAEVASANVTDNFDGRYAVTITTVADTIVLPEDMSSAFSNMKNLKRIDFSRSHIDASNVVTMDHICSKDGQLEKIDLSSMHFNSLKDSSYAFSYCEALEDVQLGRDYQSLENCRCMFEQCHGLQELNLSPLFSHSDIQNSSYIAYKCDNLESAKIGAGSLSFGMFDGCSNLEKIDVGLSELATEIDSIVDAAALDAASPLAKELLSYVEEVIER